MPRELKKKGLSYLHCAPCAASTKPLNSEKARARLKDAKGWKLTSDGKSIGREFLMKDFAAAVQLVDEIKNVAEAEDHHPDLHLTGYRHLAIELSTHSIGGLSDNDFILAAKINDLPKDLKTSNF